jgi:hypothetical protein
MPLVKSWRLPHGIRATACFIRHISDAKQIKALWMNRNKKSWFLRAWRLFRNGADLMPESGRISGETGVAAGKSASVAAGRRWATRKNQGRTPQRPPVSLSQIAGMPTHPLTKAVAGFSWASAA